MVRPRLRTSRKAYQGDLGDVNGGRTWRLYALLGRGLEAPQRQSTLGAALIWLLRRIAVGLLVGALITIEAADRLQSDS